MIRQLRSAPNLLTLLRLIFIPFIVIAVVENQPAQTEDPARALP